MTLPAARTAHGADNSARGDVFTDIPDISREYATTCGEVCAGNRCG
jgi:hypothetical protein